MQRIRQLDGIRGIAILMVLVWHYVQNQVKTEPGTLLAYIMRILGLTWSGVDLFFVLSGFLIAGILIDNSIASNYFTVFYIRRICRIFPLYFLLLGLFVIAKYSKIDNDHTYHWIFQEHLPIWSYVIFIQNIFMGLKETFGPNWLGITWSLAVEEQFYLVAPLFILYLRGHRFYYVSFLAVLAIPILRYNLPGFHTFVNTIFRADSLLCGMILAKLVRSPRVMQQVNTRKELIYIVFLILLIGAAIMVLDPNILGAFNHSWLAVLYAIFILIGLISQDTKFGKALCNPLLVELGTLSYGIYMFHQLVSGLLHGLLKGDSPSISTFSDAFITFLALIVTLGLAKFSYHCFELPIIRFGHNFHYANILTRKREIGCNFKPNL